MKILVADDDPVSQKLMARTLEKWRYDVVFANDGREALAILLNGVDHPPMAILDWIMPEVSGPEICRTLRSRPDAPFTYLILLSGKASTEDIVGGLDAGADDYLTKPFNPSELRSRIRAGERIVKLTQDLRKANHELQVLALTDDLTRLLNRAAILDRFEQELTRAARQKVSLAVVMADVDHFKNVNDECGHVAGDHVLTEFARRLKEQLRPYDAVGRYGGEEFLLVLPGVPEEACRAVADRVRQAIAREPVNAGGRTIPITASFGVAWVAPGSSPKQDAVMHAADTLLYRAKKAGRNRVEWGRAAGS